MRSNYGVEDVPRAGRPIENDEDTLKGLIDANRRIRTREFIYYLSNSTALDHLKCLCLTSQHDTWVPRILT